MRKSLAYLLAAVLMLAGVTGCSFFGGGEEQEARVIGPSAVLSDSDNYYYNALPPEERRGYDRIKAAAAAFEDYVVFDDPLSLYQMTKIFRLVYTQENGIFWLSELASPNEETNSLKLNLRYDSAGVKYLQSALEEKVREICDKAPKNDEFLQIKYIHDYIVKNCSH
jgi:hypothetical protein